MTSDFVDIAYENNDRCVSWNGLKLRQNEYLREFLNTKVANRLNDEEGKKQINECIESLELTGMSKQELDNFLNKRNPEDRPWVAAEALAESYLEQFHKVIFPWHMARDKRTSSSSLPGADIVGFIDSGSGFCFAFGEVKSSSEEKSPPRVMSGKSQGMGHQINALARNNDKILDLIHWLYFRVRCNPQHKKIFEQAAENISKVRNIMLFGVLVRDTSPNVNDLSDIGKYLRNTLCLPTTCQLTALYLPWTLKELIDKIGGRT